MSSTGPNPDHALIPTPVMTIENLQNALQSAMNGIFPSDAPLYDNITVQFVKFANDDIGVNDLEKELSRAFINIYGAFCRYKILGNSQTETAQFELSNMLGILAKGYGGPKNLLIIVFSGHGEVRNLNGQETLVVGGSVDQNHHIVEPTVDWNSATRILNTTGDVLQILDCCCASSAALGLDSEILAASTFYASASANLQSCFTASLVKKIRSSNGQPISIVQMHADLVRRKDFFSLPETPVLIVRRNKPSIVLQRAAGYQPGNIVLDATSKYNVPADDTKMVLSCHLKGSLQPKDLEKMKKWLTEKTPKQIAKIDVSFEGVFKSDSFVVLITVPIEMWSMLRYRREFGFVAMVKSKNLLLKSGPPQPQQTLSARLPGSENVRPESGGAK